MEPNFYCLMYYLQNQEFPYEASRVCILYSAVAIMSTGRNGVTGEKDLQLLIIRPEAVRMLK
jgi:hypothetical protein